MVRSPVPVIAVFISYISLVIYGPRVMAKRQAFSIKHILLLYNAFQVCLSGYMFYELFISAYLAGYDLRCQPVDTSTDPLALRVKKIDFQSCLDSTHLNVVFFSSQMAKACWWFFFSKIIDLMDTVKTHFTTIFLEIKKKVINCVIGIFRTSEEEQSTKLPSRLPPQYDDIQLVAWCKICAWRPM